MLGRSRPTDSGSRSRRWRSSQTGPGAGGAAPKRRRLARRDAARGVPSSFSPPLSATFLLPRSSLFDPGWSEPARPLSLQGPGERRGASLGVTETVRGAGGASIPSARGGRWRPRWDGGCTCHRQNWWKAPSPQGWSWGTSPNPPARETTAIPEHRNASKVRAETLPLPRLFSVLVSARKPNGFLRRCLAR